MKDHSLKLSILNALAETKASSEHGFLSGEELGERFNVSRAAISKHIKGIEQWGVDIFRIQGKGYQLAQPMQLLNQQVLSDALNTPIELIPIIGSTNQHLLDRVDTLESGTACIAEFQESGRGRRGREWVSPFGSNLYLSLYWRLDAGMAAAMGLSLVVGVAIVEALEELGVEEVKLKWPNDLYYQDRKLAGILVEMSGQAGGAAHLVIGMGINIAMPKETQGITQPWASLMEAFDGELDRNQLAVTLVNTLNRVLNEYEISGMTGFVERWNRLDNFLDRPVKLIIGPKEVEGVARGINEQGAVLLETNSGVEPYIGGEISLRGKR